MTRTTASTAAILALLTGLVLGQLSSFARPLASVESGSPSAPPQGLATARAFYDQVNQLLRTGNRSLEFPVATGFLDHPPANEPDRTLPKMIDTLLTLRATWPQLQIQVVSLEQHESAIVARLQIDPGSPRSLPGIPLPAVDPFPVTDYLRISTGGISDRWSTAPGMPVASFAIGTNAIPNDAALAIPAILRVALDPGQKAQIPLDGAALLRVESGTVQLDRESNDLDGTQHPSVDPLEAGEVRVLQQPGAFVVRNVSSDPAELWLFAGNVGQSSSPNRTPPVGFAIARIAGFIPVDGAATKGTTQRISVTRITIPPNTEIAPHETAAAESIVILDGTIAVTIQHGRALLASTDGSSQPVEDTATVSAGEGISACGATVIGYRATGPHPVTLLVMHVDS